MKTPTGYVALRKGRNNVRNCIFLNWIDAEVHITDFVEAEYTVIESLHDAEKYIIVNNSNSDGCSTIERTRCTTVNVLDNQSHRTNRNTDKTTTTTTTTTEAPSTPPSPLPPATIDINIDNDVNTNNTTPVINYNNSDDDDEIIQRQLKDLTTTNTSLPSYFDDLQNRIDDVTEATPGLPVKPVVCQNESNTGKKQNISNSTTENTQTMVYNPAIITTATSKMSSAENPTQNDMNKALSHVVGNTWKANFMKLVSYRKLDGTYPISIPDENIKKWLIIQRNEYRKKVRGGGSVKSSKLNDQKEELLRNIGVILTLDRRKNILPTTNINNNNNGKVKNNYVIFNTNQIIATLDRPIYTKISKAWKYLFKQFASYRKLDGTYPILQDNIQHNNLLRHWIDDQNEQYDKKINGLPNSMSDTKETLLRSIGFNFTTDNRKRIINNQGLPTVQPLTCNEEPKQQQQQQQQQVENQSKKNNDTKFVEQQNYNNNEQKQQQEVENERKKRNNETDNSVIVKKDWIDNLNKLKKYMHRHDGNWNVKKEDDPKLRFWVLYQQTQYLRMKEGKQSWMNDEKILLLQNIGIDFDKVVHTWSERIEQLKQYKEQNGHMNIPSKHPVLGEWVQKMIYQYKLMLAGKPVKGLNHKNIDELRKADVIDFLNVVQHPQKRKQKFDKEFEKMIVQLKMYKDEHGTCCVTSTKQECCDLYRWYTKILKEYRILSDNVTSSKCRLSTLQIARLGEIGFQFKPPRDTAVTFEERVEQLQEFKRNGGDVSTIQRSHPQFGDFIRRQRLAYRYWCQGQSSSLNEEKVNILNNLGIRWNVEKWVDPVDKTDKLLTWDERFQQLLTYKQQHGHVMVPQSDTSGLGHWVKNQRRYYKLWQQQGKKTSPKAMTAKKAIKLSNIGFIFDAKVHQDEERRKRKKQNILLNETNNNASSVDNDDDDEYNNYNNSD